MSKRLDARKKSQRVADKKQKAMKRQVENLRARHERNTEYRLNEQMKAKIQPFRKPLSQGDIQSHLMRNIEELRSLEAEYDGMMADKEQRNLEFESEGHLTLKEKFEALHQQALAAQDVGGLGVGGSAEVVFTPFEENSETG